MSSTKGRLTEAQPLHRVLREVYRRYPEFRDHVMRTGDHVIDHAYFVYEDDLKTIKEKIDITISFFDLRDGLSKLSRRKREAVFYNVILDWKQKDVARHMGITTVSVGQYVEQAMQQLAQDYFVEGFDGESDAAETNRRGSLESAQRRTPINRKLLRDSTDEVALVSEDLRSGSENDVV